MRHTNEHGRHDPARSRTARRMAGAPDKVHKVMSEFKGGELHSGSKRGPKVTSRAQAIAIGMSEQRKANRGGYKRKRKGRRS